MMGHGRDAPPHPGGRRRDPGRVRRGRRPRRGPDDALAEFARAADAQEAAFRAPGAFDRTCHHPIGDVPGAQLARFRIGDMTLHAWDVARATGGDETLDAELVADVYESMLPMTPFIGTVGVFGTGPSGTLDDAAPTQQRLLDLSGRRP